MADERLWRRRLLCCGGGADGCSRGKSQAVTMSAKEELRLMREREEGAAADARAELLRLVRRRMCCG